MILLVVRRRCRRRCRREENSPLVIQEAQHARVPVIVADIGGMAELLRGTPEDSPPSKIASQDVAEVEAAQLFIHRDAKSLGGVMYRAAANPELMQRLGERGFTGSVSGDVRSGLVIETRLSHTFAARFSSCRRALQFATVASALPPAGG